MSNIKTLIVMKHKLIEQTNNYVTINGIIEKQYLLLFSRELLKITKMN